MMTSARNVGPSRPARSGSSSPRAGHVHAGRLRLPRGGTDADEERRPHRREERPDPGDRLDRLLLRRVRHGLRRRRQRLRRRLRLLPVHRRAPHGRPVAVLVVQRDPGRGRATCSRSSSAPCRSRSSGAPWPSGRSSGSTSPSASSSRSSTRSSRTGSGARTAGCSRRACRTSPARPSCTTRARWPALAGALLLGPRIGKFGADGKPNAIPGHNMAFTTLGVIILWFGWFGFNPGSTLGVDFGGVGFFAYVALNTNIAAAGGRARRRHHVLDRDQEARPLDDAERRDRGARRDHRGVRVRGTVGRDRDRLRRRRDRRPWRAARRARAHRRPGRRDLGARHGGRLGHAVARLPRGAGAGRRASPRARAASSTAAASTSSACRPSGSPRSARSRSPPRSASCGS